MVTAHLITVGDELLIGQIINSNAAWIGSELWGAGIACTRTVTVGDSMEEIKWSFETSLAETDILIVTGGLGPTHDDLTRDALAEYFGKTLVLDENVLASIAERFARRGRKMAENNRNQAMVPTDFVVLPNERGTAPGLFYQYMDGGVAKQVFALPGVPREMKHLMQKEVLPRVTSMKGGECFYQRTLQTAGIGESALANRIRTVIPGASEKTSLAFLPRLDGVRMRLSCQAESEDVAQQEVEKLEVAIRKAAGRYIFGEGDVTIEEVVGKMLNERSLRVSVAESCTGGLVASRLTDVPGASRYFHGSLVAYSNDVKLEELGVSLKDMHEEGAVSESVVIQMATGATQMFETDVGLASTGIMGPTGGTAEKPVGTVWLAVHGPAGTESRRVQLGTERELNKLRAATALLDLLRRYLLEL